MSRAIIKLPPTRSATQSLPLVEEIAWPNAVTSWFRRLATVPGALFFDSAKIDPHLGRYSYLSADPFEVIRSRAERIEVCQADGRTEFSQFTDPMELIAQRLDCWSHPSVPGLPPFQGGAAGLFSYDLGRHFEHLPRPRMDEFQVPELAVGLYDWVIALDHLHERAWIISTGCPEPRVSRRRQRALRRLVQVQGMLSGDGGVPQRPPVWRANDARAIPLTRLASQHAVPGIVGLTSNFSRDEFHRTVARAIEYICAGDVYQVNLAQRMLFPLTESGVELYLRLREQNPAPFAGYFDLGEFVIASASPERFLSVRAREVETRPIKGTRPRWPAPEADMYSAGELQESGKDRAENVMIVDLLRNDLGRVCEYGSVRVTEPLRLESYEFVHHLVSEVRGRLRPGLSPVDLLRVSFPGGSVTGAPKIRAMEIIAELEPTARGAYCGSLGFIGFDGTMDSNILIRTFTCGRGWIQFPVGGGVVAESVPEREYEETLHKAEGMIRALRMSDR